MKNAEPQLGVWNQRNASVYHFLSCFHLSFVWSTLHHHRKLKKRKFDTNLALWKKPPLEESTPLPPEKNATTIKKLNIRYKCSPTRNGHTISWNPWMFCGRGRIVLIFLSSAGRIFYLLFSSHSYFGGFDLRWGVFGEGRFGRKFSFRIFFEGIRLQQQKSGTIGDVYPIDIFTYNM